MVRSGWSPLDRMGYVLGTWFGIGKAPVAPGTFGSLGAVPLHLLLCRAPLAGHLAAIGVVTAIGTWAAGRVASITNQKDPQIVVIDEVAGVLIAMAAVRDSGPTAQLIALVLFRVFDITKPGPIRRAEHLPPVGFGIMADDLLAGFVAALLARAGVALLS